MKFDFNEYLSTIVAESDVCIVHDQIKANILHNDEDDNFSYFDFENKMEEKNKTIADKVFESYENISRKSNIIKALDELKGPKIEAIKDCLKKEIKEENDKIKQLVNDLMKDLSA